MSNPFIYNGIPVTDMTQLSAIMNPYAAPQTQMATAGYPGPTHTQFATIDQVRAMIAEQLKPVAVTHTPQPAPQPNPMMAKFEALIQRALTPDDYKQFLAYSTSGAKDFDKMLAGEEFYPIVQLFWDTIKENIK